MPVFKYSPAVPYCHIFVPTADTVRFGALLTLALQVQRPVLLTGIHTWSNIRRRFTSLAVIVSSVLVINFASRFSFFYIALAHANEHQLALFRPCSAGYSAVFVAVDMLRFDIKSDNLRATDRHTVTVFQYRICNSARVNRACRLSDIRAGSLHASFLVIHNS